MHLTPFCPPPTHQRRERWRVGPALSLAALLCVAGCASGPKSSGERDGPASHTPAGLSKVPDAVPKVEPIRTSGPNKPYEVFGKDYTPIPKDVPFTERGLASWYGKKFHGRRTASGEVYNMFAMTAAHKTMPIPSYARVRNPKNGREIVVRINDRGPFIKGRVIDLSYTAALKLGVLGGPTPIEVQRITHAEIRSGAWQRDSDAPPPADEPDTVDPGPPVEMAEPGRALTAAAQGFWVQIGAFRQRDGAVSFQQRVAEEADWIAPMLAVFAEPSLHRLQAGPYLSRDEAQNAANRLREALQLVPVIIEKRR